jgi:bacterioferritin-associated ferredoxin
LLKQTLRCGSNCGSCLPELRKLLHSADVLRQRTGQASLTKFDA